MSGPRRAVNVWSGRPRRDTVIVTSSAASVPRYAVRFWGLFAGAVAKVKLEPSTLPSTIGCSFVALITLPVSAEPS